MADLRGCEGREPHLGAQILSISCSFWGNLAKTYVGAPYPPQGNPGSATGVCLRGVSAYAVSAQGSVCHTPVNRITDACENITLPQLRCGR